MINTWETKSGQIILIKDMTTSHIKHCINMLETKTLPYYNALIDMYMVYDGHDDCGIDLMCVSSARKSALEHLKALRNELKQRKIDEQKAI